MTPTTNFDQCMCAMRSVTSNGCLTHVVFCFYFENVPLQDVAATAAITFLKCFLYVPSAKIKDSWKRWMKKTRCYYSKNQVRNRTSKQSVTPTCDARHRRVVPTDYKNVNKKILIEYLGTYLPTYLGTYIFLCIL